MGTLETLYIKNLDKIYHAENGDVHALKDVNLTINPGEFISFVGSSGCGKSTLLRIIAGLESEFSGEIKLGETKLEGPSINRGMVFQEARLFPWLTVEGNISFGLVDENLPKAERNKIVNEHIELMNLHGFAKSYPHQLSGGMQQRVSIARALVNYPKILLLDEPFGALDAFTRLQMQQEFLRIWEIEKTTVLLVTHDVDEAIYLSDKVVVLSSRPGTISKVIHVNETRPRDRSSSAFTDIKREIYEVIFKDDNKLIDYYI
jgi:sulfonate transport system ATP-binding protein